MDNFLVTSQPSALNTPTHSAGRWNLPESATHGYYADGLGAGEAFDTAGTAPVAATTRTAWMSRYRVHPIQLASAPWLVHPGLLGLYLVLLAVAELAVTFGSPVLVFPLHGGLILLIVAYLAIARYRRRAGPEDRGLMAVALALSVAPLIRIISLTLPLAQLDPGFRYVAAGIPMALGGFLVARSAGLKWHQIGLAWHQTGWQVRAILASVAFGIIEFTILRPAPLGPAPWTAAGFLPAIGLGLFTGFPEELIFRGVLQTATRPILGRWNWIYVSAIFAVLHIGYGSAEDLVFVLCVGLFFGWIFERTRSIIGVSIGHGLANVILFYVAPNLIAAASLPSIGWQLQLSLTVGATAGLITAALLYWWFRTGLEPTPATT